MTSEMPAARSADADDRLHTTARRLRGLVEPLAAAVYFAPEAQQRYEALGLNYFEGYFCSRSASLGAAPSRLVRAAIRQTSPPCSADRLRSSRAAQGGQRGGDGWRTQRIDDRGITLVVPDRDRAVGRRRASRRRAARRGVAERRAAVVRRVAAERRRQRHVGRPSDRRVPPRPRCLDRSPRAARRADLPAPVE